MKTIAENPGSVILSEEKFLYVKSLLNLTKSENRYGDKQKKKIANYLMNGDIQPAMVVSIDPLLIACYTDELDAVVILEFPTALVEKYNLKINDYLSSINVYYANHMIYHDIVYGSRYLQRWNDFIPIIPLFLSDSMVEPQFTSFILNRTKILANEYIAKYKEYRRDGFFYLRKYSLERIKK